MSVLNLNIIRPVVLIKPPQIKYPKRTPSILPLKRPVYYRTADKTTCEDCPCFKNEAPYNKASKLRPCFRSPLTLYELAAAAVDHLPLPEALNWSSEEVAEWMSTTVGLPQYKECILVNKIDGRNLLRFEDISNLTKINIHIFDHIKIITAHIRKLYKVGFIRFARTFGVPALSPLTLHYRVGADWGIRKKYQMEFPKSMFPRRIRILKREKIPIYKEHTELCKEVEMPRKFHIENKTNETQYIWNEPPEGELVQKAIPSQKQETHKISSLKEKKMATLKELEARLMPKEINLQGLCGKELLFARRRMPKKKFFCYET